MSSVSCVVLTRFIATLMMSKKDKNLSAVSYLEYKHHIIKKLDQLTYQVKSYTIDG